MQDRAQLTAAPISFPSSTASLRSGIISPSCSSSMVKLVIFDNTFLVSTARLFAHSFLKEFLEACEFLPFS